MKGKNNYNYKSLRNAWSGKRENYFVSYAVRGPIMNPGTGVRSDMPINYPLPSGPVCEPSPLNNRGKK